MSNEISRDHSKPKLYTQTVPSACGLGDSPHPIEHHSAAAALLLTTSGLSASAVECTASDHAQIMAGLTSRAADSDLSVGDRDLADLIAANVRNEGGYQTCFRGENPAGETIFLFSTSKIQASVRFAGATLVKVHARSL